MVKNTEIVIFMVRFEPVTKGFSRNDTKTKSGRKIVRHANGLLLPKHKMLNGANQSKINKIFFRGPLPAVACATPKYQGYFGFAPALAGTLRVFSPRGRNAPPAPLQS